MERRETDEARRKETREKIQLGGLIVKAGLRLEKRSVILGALIDAAERMTSDPNERDRLQAIGKRAFGDGAV